MCNCFQHEMSPAIRTISRPYPTSSMSGERRMAAGSGTVAAPVKYYVQQGQHSMQYPQSSQRYVGFDRIRHRRSQTWYFQRVRPPAHNQIGQSQQQRVTYTQSNLLPPGSQRIISQRVVGPGGPHPPGTIIRKVVRKVVMSSPAGQKPSPAQQVIQKKRLEQQGRNSFLTQNLVVLFRYPPRNEAGAANDICAGRCCSDPAPSPRWL